VAEQANAELALYRPDGYNDVVRRRLDHYPRICPSIRTDNVAADASAARLLKQATSDVGLHCFGACGEGGEQVGSDLFRW
jgi:hypothetical protein